MMMTMDTGHRNSIVSSGVSMVLVYFDGVGLLPDFYNGNFDAICIDYLAVRVLPCEFFD